MRLSRIPRKRICGTCQGDVEIGERPTYWLERNIYICENCERMLEEDETDLIPDADLIYEIQRDRGIYV